MRRPDKVRALWEKSGERDNRVEIGLLPETETQEEGGRGVRDLIKREKMSVLGNGVFRVAARTR